MATVSILDRFLDPFTAALSPEVARRVAEIRLPEADMARIEELRLKAEQGELNASEAAEYQDIVEALDVIALLQAKARRALRESRG